MQGSMTTDRSAIGRGALVLAAAFALAAATPLVAHAGPLLSGYGGPGQGNQAILGSTLIGGPGGGASGGSGGPATGGPGSGESSSQATPGSAGGSALASRASGRLTHARRHVGARLAGTTAAAGLTPRSYPATEVTAGTSDTLGLSGMDVLYLIVAAVALAFTGVLTKIVAGTRTAKGH
jgi:hypothetical protein